VCAGLEHLLAPVGKEKIRLDTLRDYTVHRDDTLRVANPSALDPPVGGIQHTVRPLETGARLRLQSKARITHMASPEELDAAAAITPCPLALVVLVDITTGDVLFGLNTWRREYELPGGIVESGESFVDAARRELEEETGIRIDTPNLIGYARFTLTTPSRDELGAVYFAKVVNEQAAASDEMQQFVWRKPLSESDLEISALDDAIADWVARSGEAIS
jgi:8-oxo-dGTP diphosphatase